MRAGKWRVEMAGGVSYPIDESYDTWMEQSLFHVVSISGVDVRGRDEEGLFGELVVLNGRNVVAVRRVES